MDGRIQGQCHCGAVQLSAPRPTEFTECNCTLCTKLGTAWCYFPESEITISGETVAYTRADLSEVFLATHHCPTCGCTTHWAPLSAPPHQRMGLNVRLFEDGATDGAERRYCDGRSWPF